MTRDQRWHVGHQAVVRPPIVARRNNVLCRGHFPTSRQRSWINQLRGSLESSGPMIRSDSRATNFVARKSWSRAPAFNLPARFDGRILARHKISSPIQLPIPENPDCINITALTGALRWRFRNRSRNRRSNFSDTISGTPFSHQPGPSLPWWNCTRPNWRASVKTSARPRWYNTRWSCFCGRKSVTAVCILPLIPRWSPSQFSLEKRKSIRLPRASEISIRAPTSSSRKARVFVPRKTRLLEWSATFRMRYPIPASHCRLKYSTSANSGMARNITASNLPGERYRLLLGSTSCWVAHASRVLAMASRHCGLFSCLN